MLKFKVIKDYQGDQLYNFEGLKRFRWRYGHVAIEEMSKKENINEGDPFNLSFFEMSQPGGEQAWDVKV